jgi:hypothetical protein
MSLAKPRCGLRGLKLITIWCLEKLSSQTCMFLTSEVLKHITQLRILCLCHLHDDTITDNDSLTDYGADGGDIRANRR